MSDTEVDYLQPDFDPASVNMPRLRSILVSQNVFYPATAKKAQLVDIFNQSVAPRAKKLLAQRQKAKRSSMGITNIDGSQGYSVTHNDMTPLDATKRAPSPRKSTRSFKHEADELPLLPDPGPVSLSPRKRQSRSASRQPAQSDADTDSHRGATPSPRKSSRRADLTPQPEVKLEESDDDDGVMHQRRCTEPDGIFTSDNPFQGGSCPPLFAKSPSKRTITSGLDLTTMKIHGSTARRQTEGPRAAHPGSTRKTPRETPPPQTPKMPVKTGPFDDTVEAGEEFTPEEQLALAQEDAASAQAAVVPVRRPTKEPASLAKPFWALIVVLLGACGAWYRQEKIAVGYCGVGRPAQEIIPRHVLYKDYKFDVPRWLIDLVEPKCELCPPHAYCYADYSVRCEDDFILKPHSLSADGFIPLPPTCEPDGEKFRRVKAVADKAVEELRERKAKFECGEAVDGNDQQPKSPMMAVEELKEKIGEKRSKKLSNKEFDDLWIAALGEIETRDEIVVENSDNSQGPIPSRSGGVPTTSLASTSLARLPLECAVRRSIRLGLERHRVSIVSVTMAVLSAMYGRSWFRSYRATSARIPALVDLVLCRLATQKELTYEDGGAHDPFLFLPNLRDDVLRGVHSTSERERIWQRVRAVVEQNTNVRTGQREGNNGEIGRAWEWIGPGGAGADEQSVRRLNKSRPRSRGPWEHAVEPAGDTAAAFVDRSDMHKRWNEPGSRPVY